MIRMKIHVFLIVVVTLIATPSSLAQNSPFTVGEKAGGNGMSNVNQLPKTITDITNAVGQILFGKNSQAVQILDQVLGVNTKEVLAVLDELKNAVLTGFRYVTFEDIIRLFTKVVKFAGQIYFHDGTFKIEKIIGALSELDFQEIIAKAKKLASEEGLSVVNRLNEHTVYCLVDAGKTCSLKIANTQAFAYCLGKYIVDKGIACFPAKNKNDVNYQNRFGDKDDVVGSKTEYVIENHDRPCTNLQAITACRNLGYSSNENILQCAYEKLKKKPQFCKESDYFVSSNANPFFG